MPNAPIVPSLAAFKRALRLVNAEGSPRADKAPTPEIPAELAGERPLLLGMREAGKFLGVSRTSLWRLIQRGRLSKVEVYPGFFRIRRADLEQIVAGHEKPN